MTMGEPADALYFVKEGYLSCHKGGEELIRLGPSDFFGESALKESNALRAAHVVVVSVNATLLRLSAEDFNLHLSSLEHLVGENLKRKVMEAVTIDGVPLLGQLDASDQVKTLAHSIYPIHPTSPHVLHLTILRLSPFPSPTPHSSPSIPPPLALYRRICSHPSTAPSSTTIRTSSRKARRMTRSTSSRRASSRCMWTSLTGASERWPRSLLGSSLVSALCSRRSPPTQPCARTGKWSATHARARGFVSTSGACRTCLTRRRSVGSSRTERRPLHCGRSLKRTLTLHKAHLGWCGW